MKSIQYAIESDMAGLAGLFVTGTDTGVGKTWVAATLTRLLVQRGLLVRPHKPVESGCASGEGGLLPQDAVALWEAAGSTESLQQVCAYPLRAALSPERAAALEGRTLTLDQLVTACQSGIGADDFLLVEGAGGLLSPLAAGTTNADLAAALRLPVLVVAADRLGVINHTLLTVEALQHRALPLVGVVLNQAGPMTDPLMDNAADLAHWLDCPVERVLHRPGHQTPAWTGIGPFLHGLANRLAAAHAAPKGIPSNANCAVQERSGG
ncbi:dethiobiotin synthase [Acidithiobacillus sp.]|uniref:dethiobiotin synthase n=1 Tax=Acidithiobacillus sp. TaxID=1872118 RepID=UPI003D07058A